MEVQIPEAGDAEDVADRLTRAHGALELHAALLALLLPAGSRRAEKAWKIETAGAPGAEGLRKHVASLSGAARLPWFELLLKRMTAQPIAARQELLQATRRVMSARGVARPIDRLHWLCMRRGLGEVAPLAARPEANVEVAEWLESDVLAIATYTAFLSRMIPDEKAEGTAWYDSVMETWQPFAAIPSCEPPPTETMVESLNRLQTLSWMQRPLVVRYWLTAATQQSRGGRLGDLAADALRMTCDLLDSPHPPDLARHYVALSADAEKLV
ncbi:MAG: hypothetical protein ABI641_08245 [Caldimonas sp.]